MKKWGSSSTHHLFRGSCNILVHILATSSSLIQVDNTGNYHLPLAVSVSLSLFLLDMDQDVLGHCAQANHQLIAMDPVYASLLRRNCPCYQANIIMWMELF